MGPTLHWDTAVGNHWPKPQGKKCLSDKRLALLVMPPFCPTLVGHGDRLGGAKGPIAHALNVLPVDRQHEPGDSTDLWIVRFLPQNASAHSHSFQRTASWRMLTQLCSHLCQRSPCCSVDRCRTLATAWHFPE